MVYYKWKESEQLIKDLVCISQSMRYRDMKWKECIAAYMLVCRERQLIDRGEVSGCAEQSVVRVLQSPGKQAGWAGYNDCRISTCRCPVLERKTTS